VTTHEMLAERQTRAEAAEAMKSIADTLASRIEAETAVTREKFLEQLDRRIIDRSPTKIVELAKKSQGQEFPRGVGYRGNESAPSFLSSSLLRSSWRRPPLPLPLPL
jgi:hypothetical protein